MDATEQVTKFKEFFETLFYRPLLEAVNRGDNHLSIEFSELSKYSVELAEDLLEDPENTLQAARHTIEQMDLGGDTKGFEVRFSDLPETSHVMVRNIRSKHIGKFVQMEGIVRQKSDVRPQVTSARFECPSCGNIIPILQLDQKFKEPTMCACGRKGQFRLIHKELVDAQKIVLEESPDDMEGGEQPKRLDVFLRNDLVSPITDKKTNPGSKVKVTGLVKEVPIVLATGGKSTRFDLIYECNYVEPVQEEFTNLVFTEEEVEEIRNLAQDPEVFSRLTTSLAPTIYGHERIKEALLLQLFGGLRKTNDDGVSRRGDIHVLLIGDPGSGKCVRGDTKVCLGDGNITTMESLAEEHGLDQEQKPITPTAIPSLQLNGTMGGQSAVRVWKREEQELLKLTLASGKTLHVTRNHPLFHHSRGRIVAKQAGDFTPGERIATPRKMTVEGELQTFEEEPILAYNNHGKRYTFPQALHAGFARILGYWCGDGYLCRTPTSAWVSLTNNDEEVLEDYRQLFTTCFGQEPTRRHPHAKKSTSEYYVTARRLYDKLEQHFPEVCTGSQRKTIPSLVTRSPDHILAEFIKGLFECDGHVNKVKRQIEFSTISPELAETLQLALLRFGIVSSRKEKTKHATNTEAKRKVKSYDIIILGEFAAAYADEVGFVSTRKREALESIRHDALNTNVDLVPDVAGLLFHVRKSLGLAQKDMGVPGPTYAHYEQEDRLPSTSTLRKIASHVSRIAPDEPAVLLLNQLAFADVHWDRIISMEPVVHEGAVYDFEVEETHNFVANGVIVHNSQLVKRMGVVAPKARFVSGKGASGAGLTASVVKDEFLKGWALEAGALVLANKGLAAIDEMDKMNDEDTSAMHEALEQQCYDYDTVLSFADGSERRIGDYVESLFAAHPDKVREGHDCLLLEDGIVQDRIYTTDWRHIHPTTITRVSKHKAPSRMVRLTFTHGRSITVTSEHPVFVTEDGQVVTKRADKVAPDDVVPITRSLPIMGEEQRFSVLPEEVFNPRASQHIAVPAHNDAHLYRMAGYVISEGSKELNRGKPIGINFTNKNPVLIEDFKRSMQEVFGLTPYEQWRRDHHDPRMMLRYISTELVTFLQRELPELLEKARGKAVPAKLMRGKREDVAHLLQALFEGDGHVAVKERTIRIGYASLSKRLCEQVQDLLLRFDIRSSLTVHKGVYKVAITGYEHVKAFARHIGFVSETRERNVSHYLESKKRFSRKRVHKDTLVAFGARILSLMERYGIRRVERRRYTDMRFEYRTASKGISRFTLQHLLLKLERKRLRTEDEGFCSLLYGYAFGDIASEKVKSVEVVPSERPWTYDITVEPTHNFISQGMVLHNSVTISKANIQATLKCETTVLAAANPKFGRFDPYELIAKQIELPSTLINRFDLIFPIKDMPDLQRDDKMASFILNLHRKGHTSLGDNKDYLDTEFVRKYIAYAKQHVKPDLTDDALDEIKRYYVQMRNQGGNSEGQTSAIPISARQLEALVRLAEASAKSRLSQKVTRADAKRSIELVHYCLSQIGLDPETGKMDIDRITTGITASQRSNIGIIKDVISELEKAIGKMIPTDDIVREAEIKGVAQEKTNEILERLKRSGDLFSPKNGFISKI